MIARNILDLVGGTPMVRINKLVGKEDAHIYAKLEWFNPGGSIKDRMAVALIEKAEKEGKIKEGKTILEATSGNTGIALAMISAVKGYDITIVMPESASIERRKILKAHGADLVLSPAEKGTGGAIEMKQDLLRKNPSKYVDIDQFKDYANVMAHYNTTGTEILEQTNNKVDMIVVGVGTAGTGVGISLRVKEFDKNIKVVGVIPKSGVSIQGLRNPKDLNPTHLFKKEAFDEIIELGKEEIPAVFETSRKMARTEGLFAGMSSGAIMWVALKKAKEIGKGKTIVAVLPDSGNKYLSTEMYE